MRRIFDDYAYGAGPRDGCWWDETVSLPARDRLQTSMNVDVAIIGAGFTGLSAAAQLAQNGVTVAVLEANHVGWGASGRNGGFCCLGGGIADDHEMDARYGRDERLAFRAAELNAVTFVEQKIKSLGLNVDCHSQGETELAHREKDMADLRAQVPKLKENYGIDGQITEASELESLGFGGGPFFGALTIPVGFGLNPRKYIVGLAESAEKFGARIYENTQVTDMAPDAKGWRLNCAGPQVTAQHVIVATNGYSAENLPAWLAGRYMPGQSNVLVTRPLTSSEIAAQGWFSEQMSYDTRHLLHYFRLMPDKRFLFGMRGSLRTGARAEAKARVALRRHFERMFPAWADVESAHRWSGLVCLARNKVPFVGAVPECPGVWTSMCYHGNGVAMGSYCGKLVADMVSGTSNSDAPKMMTNPLARFPFGAWRRVVMPPLYANLALRDL